LTRDLAKVLSLVDGARVRRWLQEAVDTYSPTWAEGPALEVFEQLLDELELPYRKQTVDEGRYNLIVELGPQPPALLWVGHVDTVALYDEDHRHARLDGDLLHGLGAADMKSGCVAAVEALAAVAASGLPLRQGLRLALVVGEEEYGDGSERLLRSAQAPLVVIGEPTGLAPCTSHYGYFEVALRSRGARAHAALPEVGQNAIHAMLTWLSRLFEAAPAQPWADEAALTLRRIDGGTPLFAVAEGCEALLDVHLPARIDFAAVERLIHDTLEATQADHAGCQLAFEVLFSAPGFDNHAEPTPLRRAYEALGLPWAPTAFRSHSDGALFFARGMAAVICGPGELEHAHRPDERVSLSQVEQAARLYAALFFHAAR
jgi:acetylornithine deacetylase